MLGLVMTARGGLGPPAHPVAPLLPGWFGWNTTLWPTLALGLPSIAIPPPTLAPTWVIKYTIGDICVGVRLPSLIRVGGRLPSLVGVVVRLP